MKVHKSSSSIKSAVLQLGALILHDFEILRQKSIGVTALTFRRFVVRPIVHHDKSKHGRLGLIAEQNDGQIRRSGHDV